MKKYLLTFAVLYVASHGLLVLIFTFFSAPNSVSILPLMLASIGTTALFFKDKQRAPDEYERTVLIWGSIAISYAISIVFTVILFATFDGSMEYLQAIMAIPPIYLLIGLLIALAVSYFVFRMSYGWLANKMASSVNK